MDYPTSFDASFDALIGHEGGYVNDPRDPGGETKFGISKRSYPDQDIAGLSLAQAKLIYRRDFWDRLRCDALPAPLRFQVFDAAVNSGPGTAVRWLQAALGVAQDGVFGAITMQRLVACDSQALLARFNGHRLYFMTTLSTWPTFSRGWARRVAANLGGPQP